MERLPELFDEEDREYLDQAARLTTPTATCIGVAVNTAAMGEEEALAYLKETERALGLPTQDPVRQGVDRLVDNLPA